MRCTMVRPLIFPATMKWLLLLIALASGCYSLGDTLTCAYHGWKFDLGTGACLVGEEPARVYRARIEGGEVVVTP